MRIDDYTSFELIFSLIFPEENIMSVGIAIYTEDAIGPNYELWGINGSTAIQKVSIEDQVPWGIINCLVDLNHYNLQHMYKVDYYQGVNLASINAVLLRFIRKDGKNNQLYGEHISLVFDLDNKRLLGMTKMKMPLIDVGWVTYQYALEKALMFLHGFAADLVDTNIEIPILTSADINVKLEFKPAIQLGRLELNWIGLHAEKIIVDNQELIIRGIKVKTYIPDTKLWAWVIIAPNGELITFERNISWDFTRMQRQTQMWLHDGWLDAQVIYQ